MVSSKTASSMVKVNGKSREGLMPTTLRENMHWTRKTDMEFFTGKVETSTKETTETTSEKARAR